jgi:hypothetical protein
MIFMEHEDKERTVTYGPIAKQWLCKQRPLIGNARNMHATIEERGYAIRF